MENGRPRLLSEEDKEVMYEYANLYTNIYDAFGIGLWAVGGTLLGAVRSGGPIEWDDDVDYAIKEEDAEALESEEVVGLANHKGFAVLKENNANYKCVYHIAKTEDAPPRGLQTMNAGQYWAMHRGRSKTMMIKRRICSDLFLFRKVQESNEVLYNIVWSGGQAKNQHVREKDMLKCRYKFGKTHVYSFRNPEFHLRNTYGPNWATPVFTHQHR